MTRLRLHRLESRVVPATLVWDGGPDLGGTGTNDLWTTATNWVGDVAPVAGDSLTFPAGARQLSATNDFPDDFDVGTLSLTGANYQIDGNRVRLSGGVVADVTFIFGETQADPRVDLAIALAGDQTFSSTFNRGATFAGAIDLGAATLALAGGVGFTFDGPVGSTGGLRIDGGGITLNAVNTYSGPTVLDAGVFRVIGVVPGAVVMAGSNGSFSGSGSIGSLTANSGTIASNVAFGVPATLTLGGMSLSGTANTSLSLDPARTTQFRVNGSVSVGGTLFAVPNTFFPLTPGDTFTLIDNDGSDAVIGTFDGKPEGSLMPYSPSPLRLSYIGGDGNDVTLTAVSQAAFAVGAGPGGLPQVNVYDGIGTLIRSFAAYETTFTGGVHVVTADVTGDFVPDIITAPGDGGGPLVKVFDGTNGQLVRVFLAYDINFRGGNSIAVVRINTDGTPDFITGAGPGGGPHVKVFDGATGAEFVSLFAYDASFRGGVAVAGVASTSDRFGSRPGAVITGAGPGGGPHVRRFNLQSNGTVTAGPSYFAYDASFRGGVAVAVDPTSNRVITAPGVGGGPVVRAFELLGELQSEFLAYDASFRGGVNIGTARGPDGQTVILTGAGVGGGPHVRQFTAFDAAPGLQLLAFDPAFLGGVFVG